MKKNKNSTLSFISEVTGKKKVYILFLLLIQVFLGISSVAYAFLFRGIIDGAVSHDKHTMIVEMVLLILLVLVQITIRAVARFLEELSRSTYENTFKGRLFKELLFRDYDMVMATHSGEWMNRLTSDTVVVADGMATIVPSVAGMLTRMTGAILMILVLEPRFGILLLLGGIVLVILTYTFRKKLKGLHKIMQEEDGKVRIFLQEHLSSLLVIKVFGKESDSLLKGVEQMKVHQRARMKKNHFSNICNIGFGGAMNGVYVLGIIYSAFGIYYGTMTYGTLMAILQLIGQIQSPFANITGYLPKYYAMLASAERLKEVEDYIPTLSKGILAVEEAKNLYQKELLELVFENVNFSYERENKVLQNYSFQIKKGSYVAITGTSGCGKSTLLKLLMGLYQPETGFIGTILKNGQKIPIHVMKRLFAYVPQGNYLMSGTIREVIAFGKEMNEEKLEQVITLACAQFIYDLPEGLGAKLGEKGAGLSEGQMQRIAIARALFADVPILILDEATSALDEKTEKQIVKNLKQLTDKTVLIVTHRPQAIKICDNSLKFT